MSAIAPLPSEPTLSLVSSDDEREEPASAPPAQERRMHVWYAFGRWLETWDVVADEGFVLA